MLKLSQSIKVKYITMLTHFITLFFGVIIVFTVRNECSADRNQMPKIPELAQVCTFYVLNFRSVPMKTKTRKSCSRCARKMTTNFIGFICCCLLHNS